MTTLTQMPAFALRERGAATGANLRKGLFDGAPLSPGEYESARQSSRHARSAPRPATHLEGGRGSSHKGGHLVPGKAPEKAPLVRPSAAPASVAPPIQSVAPAKPVRKTSAPKAQKTATPKAAKAAPAPEGPVTTHPLQTWAPANPTPEVARENARNSEFELHHGDALELLKRTPSGSVQCITTDPPYASLDKWRGVGTTTRLGGGGNKDADNRDDWFSTISNDTLREVVGECVRVLAKDGHMWMMVDGATLGHVLMEAERLQSIGEISYFKPYPVVKMTAGGKKKQGMGYHGRATHEYVVLMKKGKKQRGLNERNWPDVFEVNWDGGKDSAQFTDDGSKYPTAKPPALLRQWVALSTNPGERVLDPFMGSGSAGVAATALGRDFLGFDLSEKSMSAVGRRLESLKGDPDKAD